jgi:predicted ferric reductase
MRENFDEKKWKNFNTITDVIVVVLAVTVADITTECFFNDNFWIGLIIAVIVVGILALVQRLVLSIVENSEFLSKPFLKK